jgi:hypothetical protein
MSENDEKPVDRGVGEIVSLDEARQKAEAHKAEANEPQPEAPAQPNPLNNALQPIMAAIARELAGLAGPDGTIKLDQLSEDEQTKAKTAALLRGLGQGLGDVLAQALGKWADKVNLNFTTAPPAESKIESTPIRSEQAPPGAPGAEDPTKKS